MDGYEPTSGRFSVFSWNVLADKCADQDPQRGFPLVPREHLEWDARLPKIRSVLSNCRAGIICLQEVDKPEELQRILMDLNYEVVYILGGDCMIAFKKILFKLKQTEARRFLPGTGNQVHVAVQLLFDDYQILFWVVCTHLKAGIENSDIRAAQIDELLAYHDKRCRKDDLAVIICGDFNAEPDSLEYAMMTRQHSFMDSCKSEDRQTEGNRWTTFKIRNGKTIKRTIDYIFCSGKIWPVYTKFDHYKFDDEPLGLPCERWPSDHISQSCVFQIKKSL